MVLTGPLNQLNSVACFGFDLKPFTLQVTSPDDLERNKQEGLQTSLSKKKIKIYAGFWDDCMMH